MKISVSKIKEISTKRRAGYFEEVMSSGTLSEDGFFLTLSDDEYSRLKEKYRIDSPTKTQMAKSLARSVGDWVKSGLPLSDHDMVDARLSVCKGCDFWDDSGFSGTGRCMKCGCSTYAKLRMATEKCPLGKW